MGKCDCCVCANTQWTPPDNFSPHSMNNHNHPFNETAPTGPFTNGEKPSATNPKPQVDALEPTMKNATEEINSASEKEMTEPQPEPAAPAIPDPHEEAAVADIEPATTSTVPPPVEQPTTDLRDDTSAIPEPATDTSAPADSHTDQEMTDAPEEKPSASEDAMDVSAPEEKSSACEDVMDVSAPDGTEPAGGEELALRPNAESAGAPTPTTEPETLPAEPEKPSEDSEAASAGQVHPRDEDEEVERSAKRAKTEEEHSPSEHPAEFKVPGMPASSSQPPAPVTENGAVPAPSAGPPGLPTGTPDLDSQPITPSQKKHILEAIRRSVKIKVASAFKSPVDDVLLNIPTYYQIITNPMDMGTMENKLKNDQYASANAVAADMDLIVQNALTFNGPTHPITVAGMNLRAYFFKLLATLPKRDAAEPQKKKKQAPAPKPQPKPQPQPQPVRRESRAATAKSPPAKPVETHQPFVGPDGVPLIRRDSNVGNDRPKREIHPPKNRDLPYPTRPKKKKSIVELKFCQSVLQELLKKRYSTFNYPFLQPVDPVALNIPNYFKVIKKPTDLSTIQKRLASGDLGNAKEFHAEVKQMFTNCYKFNPPEDSVHKMGRMLEEVFDKAWAGKDAFLAEQMRGSEPESPEPESDAEGEEDENSVKLQRMREIQEQIAALSQEAMQLTTTAAPAHDQRKSPKAVGKKAKGGKAAVPKVKRTNSMAAPVAAKHAAKKKKTFRRLTLDQKRYVSDAIGRLTESEMNKAVQIIRNGVPRLRDVHDDELELDIEEIPEDVVFTLYEFVRKIHPAENDNDDDDYMEDAPAAKPLGTARLKKSKPMSAREQESKIEQYERRLQELNNSASDQSPQGNGYPSPALSDGANALVAHHDEDSSDDAQSESSEEE
jgi:bromodomain-containing factor 1